MGGSLPFRSGVVVSLRPLSDCHGSMWPVPAFSLACHFPSQYAHTSSSLAISFASCLPFTLLRALGMLVPVASLLH